MSAKQAWTGVAVVLGVLIVCSLLIPAVSPTKNRFRAQRVNAVNGLPRVELSMPLSNTPAASSNSPSAGK